MLILRQNATHKVVIGPVVAVGDGFTPVTNLVITGAGAADEAEAILHNTAAVVDISAYTFAAIATADGYYHLTLQAGISSTVGHMTVVINDDSLCLPVRADFQVVEEAVYDAMYAAGAVGPALASVCTAARLAELDAAMLPADIAAISLVVPDAAGTAAALHAITDGAIAALVVPDAAGTAAALHAITDGAIAALNDPTAATIAAAVWALAGAIDGATPAEAMQIIAAAVAGELSGAGTGTEVMLGLDGLTTRITASIDASYNRTAVVY